MKAEKRHLTMGAESHSTRPILAGDVVVGYWREGDNWLPERVTAVADDPEVQAILDDWFVEWKAERKREARAEAARMEAEAAERKARRRAEARRALGLD